MLGKHRTKEGQEMLIAEMDDSHLINTLLLMLDNLSKFRSALDDPNQSVDPLTARLNSRTRIDVDTAATYIRAGLEKAQPYLAELFLRGMEMGQVPEVRKRLRFVAGRSAALPHQDLLLAPAQKYRPKHVNRDMYDAEIDYEDIREAGDPLNF
jgi:hypothetical protein